MRRRRDPTILFFFNILFLNIFRTCPGRPMLHMGNMILYIMILTVLQEIEIFTCMYNIEIIDF